VRGADAGTELASEIAARTTRTEANVVSSCELIAVSGSMSWPKTTRLVRRPTGPPHSCSRTQHARPAAYAAGRARTPPRSAVGAQLVDDLAHRVYASTHLPDSRPADSCRIGTSANEWSSE
jgi:hypothetical protein